MSSNAPQSQYYQSNSPSAQYTGQVTPPAVYPGSNAPAALAPSTSTNVTTLTAGGNTTGQGTSTNGAGGGTSSTNYQSLGGGAPQTLAKCMANWEPNLGMDKTEWRDTCIRTLNGMELAPAIQPTRRTTYSSRARR